MTGEDYGTAVRAPIEEGARTCQHLTELLQAHLADLDGHIEELHGTADVGQLGLGFDAHEGVA